MGVEKIEKNCCGYPNEADKEQYDTFSNMYNVANYTAADQQHLSKETSSMEVKQCVEITFHRLRRKLQKCSRKEEKSRTERSKESI